WFCRNAVEPGRWNNMAISPASTTNYDWFLDTFCAADRALAEQDGKTIHDALAGELDAAFARASSILYHPYLFGSPMGAGPSAGFLGLRGWHERGDLLAALLEGVVFNHRQHIEALRDGFAPAEARLTGGASRNPAVAQLFADILNMPVTVTDTDEAAAWGAALCAGAAVGAFARFDADPRDLGPISTRYRPDPDRTAHYKARYGLFREIGDEMSGIWRRLDVLGDQPRGAVRD
ncbi:MAG: FGGY-family carbohydrate kinase, partial [Pseudomonadota bacterium]